jgi:hypothetical protein
MAESIVEVDMNVDLLEPQQEARWQRIERRIIQNARHLRKQGCLARQGTRGSRWCLRFLERLPTGGIVHRSIYLGSNPELVRRARLLLARCREHGNGRREVAALSKMVAEASAFLPTLLARLHGARQSRRGGRRVRGAAE